MTYTFTPRRPVKSFQDLEVYQKLLAVSVAVVKRITIPHAPLPILPDVKNKSLPKAPPPIGGADIADVMVKTALDLPLKIATAHSLRFSDQLKAVAVLEDVMLGCNLLIVYLEQYRDIYNTPPPHAPLPNAPPPKLPDIESKSLPKAPPTIGGADLADIAVIENEFFEEQIRILLTTRFKVMHLQMSWKKFMKE